MPRLIRRPGDVPARSLWSRLRDVALMDVAVLAKGGVSPGSLERVEEILLEADLGVATTMQLVADLERRAKLGKIRTEPDFRGALRSGIEAALRAGNSDPALRLATGTPTVILVIGVNGAGKTTFVGKLAARLRRGGRAKIVLGAADTFRAGAVDQLKQWADRAGADFVGARAGTDPASVAFETVDAAVARNADVAIIDTAGRLHTSDALLEEMRKIHRVIGKRLPGAPHETLLVLDGTIGQNAIAQATTFSAAVPVTGIVMNKVDGSARGGIVVAVHQTLDVPVKFLGVGEKLDDL
ncbi:MAG: signal recognition particle-docking protein FtsY, partial [Gemmatimonadota bacterium]|nr:signal recognition particle-docking protein FtsY [Gemmatimonadota bacterium]